MMNVDHMLDQLAEFPILVQLAKEMASANKLDGRACRYILQEEVGAN